MSRDAGTDLPGGDVRRLDRREFLRKLIAAGIGLPAALALAGGLTGCGGHGILVPPDDGAPGPGPQGLAQAVQAGLAELQAILAEMRAASPNIDQAMRDGWLARLNALAAQVWNAAAAATPAGVQANVHPDAADLDARLHEWETPYDFSGAAPQWTAAMLDGAVDRAFDILQAHPGADFRALFVYIAIGCALHASMLDDEIYFTAMAAAQEDTEGKSGQLLDMVLASVQAQTASEMSPACYELFLDPEHLGLYILIDCGMYWLFALMCAVSRELALFFAFQLGLLLLMCTAPGPAEDRFHQYSSDQ